MKTTCALAVMVETADPTKGSIIHLCFYEQPPTQHDVDAFIAELGVDEEFGLTDKVCDVDYFIQELSASTLREVKTNLHIPDDLE